MAKLQKIWILCLLGLVLSFSAATAEETSDPNYADDAEEDYDDEDESSNVQASISSEPLVLVQDKGDTVLLPCEGVNLQKVAVIWQKGNNILAAGEVTVTEDKRISLILSPNQLQITNITAKDAGDYTCKTTSARSVEVTHTLRVNDQPRASVKNPLRVAKDGEPVTLSCDVTGYPEPTVTWERKGKKMPSGETKIQGAELTFSRVARHHSGTYECVAQNALGMARTAVSLVVAHAPEIDVEKESVNSGRGYDAELVCIVHAEPKAHVVWYKDGRTIESNKHTTEQRQMHHWILHLKNVNEYDFGNYTCVANNSLGRSNKSIYLTGAPSQPMLKEESRGEHMSYTLTWALESATEVEEFRIKYRKNDEDWMEETVKGEKIQGHVYNVRHTFKDLSTSSDYEVKLQAANSFGWSLDSRPKKFHINGDHQTYVPVSEPGAKEAIGTGASGRTSSSLLSTVSFAFISAAVLRWQL